MSVRLLVVLLSVALGTATLAQEAERAGPSDGTPPASEPVAPEPAEDAAPEADTESGEEDPDTVLIFDPSEEISEDLSVAFPADI